MTNAKMLLMSCLIGMGFMATSCSSSENEPQSTGETGNISLSLTASTGFSANTRSVNEADYKNVNLYTIQILNSAGVEKVNYLYDDLPSKIKLENGSYTLKAFYGEDKDASRNGFYVEGSSTFTVQGADQTLNVDCAPVCGKVAVNFDESMDKYFSDYSVVYETSALTAANTTATWVKADTEPWYLKLNKDGETVKATIHVTRTSDGKSITTEKTYNLERNKSWTLNIAPKDDNGSMTITISIDESTEDHEIDIVVPSDWI